MSKRTVHKKYTVLFVHFEVVFLRKRKEKDACFPCVQKMRQFCSHKIENGKEIKRFEILKNRCGTRVFHVLGNGRASFRNAGQRVENLLLKILKAARGSERENGGGNFARKRRKTVSSRPRGRLTNPPPYDMIGRHMNKVYSPVGLQRRGGVCR